MIARLARIIACALPLFSASAARAEPQTVFFKSADGATEIVGYLFKPTTPGPHPAVVLMHGRAGPYSTNDNAGCTRLRLPAWLHSVLTFAAAITLPPNFSVSSTKTKNCGRSAFRKGSLADQPLKFTIIGGLTTAAGSHHRSGRCASP
jgi:hypothetical protein